MLTLNEIRNVNFRKSNFGGYRAEDVEAFIDEVQLSYDSLLKENAELLKRLESLTAKLEEYQQEEDSIRNALMNAQKVGDASLRDAKHKAEIILKDATIKAEKIVSNAQIEIHRERDVIEKMQRDIADFKAKLLKVYKEHLTLINTIPNEDIMRQETKDAVSSVPMLDRDTNPYASQSQRSGYAQDNYAYADRRDNDAFGNSENFGASPISNFDNNGNDFRQNNFGNPSSDLSAQNDFSRFTADEQRQTSDFRTPSSDFNSEQPIMPRERMNQSRGGFTVNIDDDIPTAQTTTLPPPMREQQKYSDYDDAPSYNESSSNINDFDRSSIGSYNTPISSPDDSNFLSGNDNFTTPAYDIGNQNSSNDSNAGFFSRRR